MVKQLPWVTAARIPVTAFHQGVIHFFSLEHLQLWGLKEHRIKSNLGLFVFLELITKIERGRLINASLSSCLLFSGFLIKHPLTRPWAEHLYKLFHFIFTATLCGCEYVSHSVVSKCLRPHGL